MTKAVFTKQNGLWTSIKVSGHSGYANHGSDIVCAGISTAVISSINLLIIELESPTFLVSISKSLYFIFLNDL